MQSCFYKVDRPASRPGKGSLWVSTRSGCPSNLKFEPGTPNTQSPKVETPPPVAERMPPVVKDFCTLQNHAPQVHSWSGDLWLESGYALRNTSPLLFDLVSDEVVMEDNCSESSGPTSSLFLDVIVRCLNDYSRL